MAISEERWKLADKRAKEQEQFIKQQTARVEENANKYTAPTQRATQKTVYPSRPSSNIDNYRSMIPSAKSTAPAQPATPKQTTPTGSFSIPQYTNPIDFIRNIGGQTNWNWGVDPLKDVKETYWLSTYDVDKASEHVTDYRKQLVQLQDEMSRLRYQQGVPEVKERYAQLRAQAEELDNKISKTNTDIEKATELQDSIAYQKEVERLLPLDIEGTKAQKTAKEQQLKPIQEKIKAIELELKYPSGNSPYGSVADMQAELKRLTNLANELEKEIPALGNDITEARRLQAFYQKGEEYSALMGNADFDYYTAQGASIVARDNYANPDLWLQTAKQSDPTPGVVGSQRDIEQASRQNLGDKDRRSLAREMAGSYKYMTKDEFNIYCYLLAKEGRASAQQYEIYLAETINAREGQEKGEAIRSIDNKTLRTLATAGSAVAGGLDTVLHSAHQLINEERIPTHAAQYTSQTVRNDLGAVGKVAYDALYGVSQMAPSILVSSVLGPGAGAVVQGLSSAGSAYNQALSDGYTKQEATDYALLIGASEAVLQKTLGGIDKLGGMSGKIAKAVSRIDDALLRVASQAGLSMLSEAGEEYLQAVLEPVYRNWLLDEENKIDLLSDEALYSGLVGALISAGFNAPDTLRSLGDARLERTATPIFNQKDLDSALAKALAELRAQPTGEERLNESARMILEQKKNAQTTDVGTENNSRLTDADLAEYLTVGEREHVRNTKHNQIKAGDSPILTSISAIKDFILNSALGRISNTIKAYGKVGKSMAADVMSASDGTVDINGYYLELEANHLNHLNDHVQDDGDPRNIPLTQEQLLQLPEYIDNYDDVLAVVTKKNGSKRIYLGKEINGHSVVVVLVSKGRRSIHPQTAWTNSTDHYREKYGKKRSTKYIPTTETVEDSGYRSASNPHIPQPEQSVNRENVDDIGAQPAMGAGVGDMGAKTSDFRHEVKESQSKTTPHYYEQHNIPEQGRADNHYTVVHEDESLNNARLRLEQDYEGEVNELRGKASWSNEEMDMGQMVLDDLRSHAEETGDWGGFRAWARVVNEHKTEAGRSLQALAKYNRDTGSAILSYASKLLENASKGTDVNAVMQTVSEFATQFDKAVTGNDISSLVDLIKNTARARKTGFYSGKLGEAVSKPLDWALNRIAEYAKAEILNNAKKDDSTVKVQSFNVGDVVKTKDRGNYGKVLSVNDDGTYNIHFRAKTGHEATVKFSPDQILPTRKDSTTVEKDNASPAYSFLKDFAATSIVNVAGDTNRASLADMVLTIRRNSMLSKLSTTLRNLVGNGVFGGVDTLARDISVPLDMLLSKITKTRSVAMDYGIFSQAKRKGTLDGLAMAMLETSLDVNARDLKSKYENGAQRTFKMSGGVVSKVLSIWEGIMGYRMYVTDEMAKGGTSAEVQRGLDTLYDRGKIKAEDDSLRTGGAQESLYRTFQDDSFLSRGLVGTRNSWGLAGDMLMPFAQIPGNLADRAIDYSPAGLVESAYRLTDVLIKAKKGTLTAAEQASAVQNIGRNITGSSLIALATALALRGLIHVVNPGGEDENKAKAASEKSQNLSGTQWNLSATLRDLTGESTEWRDGDYLMSIAFLEPFNSHLTIGALLAEDLEAEGSLDIKTILRDSFAGSLTAILDLPLFSVVKDATNAYQYSDKDRAGERILDAGLTLGANAMGSIIPNDWRGIVQGLDLYQRDLYSKDTLGGKIADNYRSVFARDSLPTKQDVYGKDVKNENRVLNFLNTNVLPGSVVKYKETDLQRALNALARESGDNAVFLSHAAPKTIPTKSGEHTLTLADKRRFMVERGDTYEAVSSALEANKIYQGFSSDMQVKIYGYGEAYANQKAKDSLGVGFETDPWVSELAGAAPEVVANAIIQKAVENEAKNHEGGKYVGLGSMLDEGSINEELAIASLPATTHDKYMKYRKDVPISDLLDAISYKNKTDAKKEDMEKYLNMKHSGKSGAKVKIGIWCTLYAESTCPW